MQGCLYQEAGSFTRGGAHLALETQLSFTHKCQCLDPLDKEIWILVEMIPVLAQGLSCLP